MSHPNLTLLPPEELQREVIDSKVEIERKLDTPCLHFCYPYGMFNEGVSSAAARAGYEAATTTVSPGRNVVSQNRFALRRFQMPERPGKLGYILSGFRSMGPDRRLPRLPADKGTGVFP